MAGKVSLAGPNPLAWTFTFRSAFFAHTPELFLKASAFSLSWRPPEPKKALIRADKELWTFRSASLCQHVDALTTENKTEHETDSKRGKDRLRRVLADVLLAVVLKIADTIARIIPYLFRATQIFIGYCACR